MSEETVLQTQHDQHSASRERKDANAPNETDNSIVEAVEAKSSSGKKDIEGILDELVLDSELLTATAT